MCVCVYNLLIKSVLELTHIVVSIFSNEKRGGKRKQSCNEIRLFLLNNNNFFNYIYIYIYWFTMYGMRWDMTSFGDFGNTCLEMGYD